MRGARWGLRTEQRFLIMLPLLALCLLIGPVCAAAGDTKEAESWATVNLKVTFLRWWRTAEGWETPSEAARKAEGTALSTWIAR